LRDPVRSFGLAMILVAGLDIGIPIIVGVAAVGACFIVLGNLLADLAAPLIDPRVRSR
jgi:ABC-type dipeptide/oligopeptide/nickel transport system permease component